MPASMISPSRAMTPIGLPTGTSVAATPMIARGAAASTVKGCSSDSKVPASTMKTSTSAKPSAKPSCLKVRARSSSSPASRARSPGASAVASRASSAAARASGYSAPGAMRAVTRATRLWSRRKISRAPVTASNRATSPSATLTPCAVVSLISASSSRRTSGKRSATSYSSSPVDIAVTTRPSSEASSSEVTASRSMPRPSARVRRR